MAKNSGQAKFEACMVLSGVGDAIGYKNGAWEFCRSGERIHEQLQLLGGIENIKVDPQKWMISDDTVMHIATAEALISKWANHEELFHALAKATPNYTLISRPPINAIKTSGRAVGFYYPLF